MSGRGLARLVPLVLVLAGSLSACGGDDADPSTGSPAASESPSSSTSSATPGDESGSDDTGDDSVTVEVTREGDTFTPNGERVEMAVGQTLVLQVTADEAGELHVHSTPEQDLAYEAGTSEHEITIDRPGVVEVESHDPDSIVLQLEVR